jgi:hypothetical protein
MEIQAWNKDGELTQEQGLWLRTGCLIVPPDEHLREEVLHMTHDHPTTGHPRILKTLQIMACHYWWPQLCHFVQNYVKGCAICQSTKPTKVKKTILLYLIGSEDIALPFTTIALDFIMDLPKLVGYDAILTITNHDVTKATIFLPCNTTISSEEVVSFYTTHVFPHFGVP